MEKNIVTVVIGLVGALIGGLASLGAVWIQSHYQSKRDRLKLVADLALQDHKTNIELAKMSRRPFSAPPVTLYLHYHLELAKLLERGSVTPEEFKEVAAKNKQVMRAIEEAQEPESNTSHDKNT